MKRNTPPVEAFGMRREQLAPRRGFEPRLLRSRRRVLPLNDLGMEASAGFEPT